MIFHIRSISRYWTFKSSVNCNLIVWDYKAKSSNITAVSEDFRQCETASITLTNNEEIENMYHVPIEL